jgi:hypothetical protein
VVSKQQNPRGVFLLTSYNENVHFSKEGLQHVEEKQMRERKKLGFIVVITTFRKTEGGVRDGRNNFSGKMGRIYQNNNGSRGEEIFRAKAPTFQELSKILHGAGKIPPYIAINKSGETYI